MVLIGVATQLELRLVHHNGIVEVRMQEVTQSVELKGRAEATACAHLDGAYGKMAFRSRP